MGLFNFDFNKPGKGVKKEDLQKHRFIIFFEVFFRKFMKFMQLNLLFLVFSLPYLLILYILSPFNASALSNVTLNGIGDYVKTLDGQNFMAFDMMLRMLFTFSIAILWGTGPASAGTSYIIRNFSREEHAWVFSDFWDSVKSNFIQSIVVLAIDMLAIYLSLVAFNFYSIQYASTSNSTFLIAQGFLFVILIIYTIMHYYIYQIMISYENKLKELYKNSMLFTIAKFPQNIFFTAIVIAIILGMYLILNVFAFLVFVMLLTIFCKFIIEFYTSEVIRKNAITK